MPANRNRMSADDHAVSAAADTLSTGANAMFGQWHGRNVLSAGGNPVSAG